MNLLMRNDGRIINLGSKATVTVNAGVISTYLFAFCVCLKVIRIKWNVFRITSVNSVQVNLIRFSD